MLACVKTLKKYNPGELVTAVPVVTPVGARIIANEVDKLIYLTIEPQPFGSYYAEFPDVSDEEVLSLLKKASADD